MMHGFMGQAAQIKRDAGAREVLAKHPDMKLLAAQTAEWDRAKAVTLSETGKALLFHQRCLHRVARGLGGHQIGPRGGRGALNR